MATSVILSRSALMPLPEPVPEIVTTTPGFFCMKASETCCMTGRTVVEPLRLTVPTANVVPQAARTEAAQTKVTTRRREKMVFCMMNKCSIQF